MSKYKTILEVVDTSDKTALKNMQKKINQWTTDGSLKKFATTHSGGTMMLFTILKNK